MTKKRGIYSRSAFPSVRFPGWMRFVRQDVKMELNPARRDTLSCNSRTPNGMLKAESWTHCPSTNASSMRF